jgi:hypothetical protein
MEREGDAVTKTGAVPGDAVAERSIVACSGDMTCGGCPRMPETRCTGFLARTGWKSCRCCVDAMIGWAADMCVVATGKFGTIATLTCDRDGEVLRTGKTDGAGESMRAVGLRGSE